MVGVECALIAFILILISLFGIWFSARGKSYESGFEELTTSEWTINMGLTEYEIDHTDRSGSRWYEKLAYADQTNDPKAKVVLDVAIITVALLAVALVFILAMLILTFLYGLNKANRKTGLVAGVLGTIFTMAGFVFFAIAFGWVIGSYYGPSALPRFSGFFGSSDYFIGWYEYESVWGPGWSWFLVVFAFFVMFIGTSALRAPVEEEGSQERVEEEGNFQASDNQ